jgi:hypothetical protein
VVLHPRKADGPALKATLLSANGQQVKLQIEEDGKSDLVTMRTDGAVFQRHGSPPVLLPMKVAGNAEDGARFIPENK